MSCEFSRAIRVGRAPHFFLNRALLRLNPALGIQKAKVAEKVSILNVSTVSIGRETFFSETFRSRFVLEGERLGLVSVSILKVEEGLWQNF